MDNTGMMQGDTIALTAKTLNNSGVLNGLSSMQGALTGQLLNQGQIQSGGALSLVADNLSSAGRIAGDTLSLSAGALSNTGLWQGMKGLTTDWRYPCYRFCIPHIERRYACPQCREYDNTRHLTGAERYRCRK